MFTGGIPLASWWAWCIMKFGGGMPFIGCPEKADGGKWSLGTPPRDVSMVGTGLGPSSNRGERRPLGMPGPWGARME